MGETFHYFLCSDKKRNSQMIPYRREKRKHIWKENKGDADSNENINESIKKF